MNVDGTTCIITGLGTCTDTEIVIPQHIDGYLLTSIGNSAFYYCTRLTSITFEGTVEQWNAITKGYDWKYNVPATEVVCSNGTVSLVE